MGNKPTFFTNDESNCELLRRKFIKFIRPHDYTSLSDVLTHLAIFTVNHNLFVLNYKTYRLDPSEVDDEFGSLKLFYSNIDSFYVWLDKSQSNKGTIRLTYKDGSNSHKWSFRVNQKSKKVTLSKCIISGAGSINESTN